MSRDDANTGSVPAVRSVRQGGDWCRVVPLASSRTAFVAGSFASDPRTVLACVFDPVERTLHYASTGHCPGLLVDTGDRLRVSRWLEPPRRSRDGAGDAVVRLEVPREARLVLFGETLVAGSGGVDAGLARLHGIVTDTIALPVGAVADRLLDALAPEPGRPEHLALLVADLVPIPPPFEVSVRPEPREAATLRTALRGWLESSLLDQSVVDDVVIAANEAVNNAIEHGSPDPSVAVAVRAERVAEEVRVEVADRGGRAAPHSDLDRGRGIPMMWALMDSVDVTTRPDGTTVRMARRLDTDADDLATR